MKDGYVKKDVGGRPLNSDFMNLISLAVALKTLYGNRPLSRRRNSALIGLAIMNLFTLESSSSSISSYLHARRCFYTFSNVSYGFLSYASFNLVA